MVYKMRIFEINQALKSSFQDLKQALVPGLQDCLYCHLSITPAEKSEHSHLICNHCYQDLEHTDHQDSQHQIVEPKFDRAFYPLDYGDTSKRLIQNLKQGVYCWSYLASEILAHHLQVSLLDKLADGTPLYISHIPMTKAKYRVRATNPAEVLAALVARQLKLKHLTNTIIVNRPLGSQKLLSANARKDNVRQAFSCRADVEQTHWLIIDDVLTTGHTLNEAAGSLKQAGAEVVFVASLARTPLDSPRQD